jgi:F-type H+-transporting ATPase subunit c
MKSFIKMALISVAGVMMGSIAFAQEAAETVTKAGGGGMVAIGAGLAIGIAALGGAFGQGKAAAAAFEGIARNPAAQGKIFLPMMIGLAFIESLVIYSLIIALQLSGKV